MKKITQIAWLLILFIGSTYAQQEKGIIGDDNWLQNWTDFQPKLSDYREPTQILAGNISEDIHLLKRNVYLLMGDVFVTDSTTVTIEPGTVIIGDYDTKATLTITKGAKLIAEGTETDPIIFTSNRSFKKEGDWGGIIILGDAPTNKFGNGSVASFYPDLSPASYAFTNFGGTNKSSNSGILRYVRIEYAGKRIGRGNYLNALLLAGVGSNTQLENIMVSHAAGNAFQIWGGEFKVSKAVSYRNGSNDFNFNYGAQCVLENSLAIRSPFISNSAGSRCMYVRSYDKKEEVDFAKNGTSVTAKNITFLNTSNDLKTDIDKGLINEALFVGHNANLDMSKSVISGFNPAVIFENTIAINQENLEKIKFTGMYFNNCNGNIFVENNSNNEDLENWYGNSAFLNVYSKSANSETFIDTRNARRPDFRLRINKIIAAPKEYYAADSIEEE